LFHSEKKIRTTQELEFCFFLNILIPNVAEKIYSDFGGGEKK
jgi:hypothetical protein